MVSVALLGHEKSNQKIKEFLCHWEDAPTKAATLHLLPIILVSQIIYHNSI